MLTYIRSPLDQFDISILIGLNSPICDLSALDFTTFSLYTLIVLITIILIYNISLDRKLIIGSNWLLTIESTMDTIINMVKGQIGGKVYGYYVPLVYTLFIFILIANLIGMIPYNFAIAASLIFIISLSFSLWLGFTILGFYIHKFEYFSLLVPVGTPLALLPLLVLIELLSYSARAISLGLRLAANTLSGHLLMGILGGLVKTLMSLNIFSFILGFIPLAGIFCIVILEFAIACIQAYVFTILTSSYIKDSVYLH